MRTGALNIRDPQPARHGRAVKELARYRINIFPGVNTLFNGLASRPEFARPDPRGLVISNGGGMAVRGRWRKEWLGDHRLPRSARATASVKDLFGITCNPTDSDAHRHHRPAVAQRRIAILASRAICRSARAGEIAIRGLQVMAGYWQRPGRDRPG